VIMTGGLGPTRDDKTKDALCDFFKTPLVFNEEAYKNIEKLFLTRNVRITAENRKQAELPDCCTALPNQIGTAWGMWFELNGKIIVSLPGVPYEMEYLMKNEVLPRIISFFKTPYITHKTIHTIGAGESILAEMIETWEDSLPPFISLAYLPSPGTVRLRLSATGDDKEALRAEIEKYSEKLYRLIPDLIFGYGEDTIENVVGRLLKEKGKTLSTAESCTGGYISHLITSVAGSSEYYKGSVIAYSNEAKIKELKVEKGILDEYGAVSRQTAEQMASGSKMKFSSDFAVGITGIAGPSGGSEEKPVGTVWIAVAGPQGVVSQKFLFGEHRGRNIRKSALMALDMLRKAITKDNTINKPGNSEHIQQLSQ
jgi:nicotinamide-nucleotide amidase